MQLCTVRYLGTFLEDPTAVPPSVTATLARSLTRQLGLSDHVDLRPYRAGTARWDHTTAIRQRWYGIKEGWTAWYGEE